MAENPAQPQPNPELKRLDRLVGRWSMEGNLVGSDETNITGETAFRWLPGGFFLEQRVHIDFMGTQIDALELIGHDPETNTFPSTVYSKLFRRVATQPRRRRNCERAVRHRRPPSRLTFEAAGCHPTRYLMCVTPGASTTWTCSSLGLAAPRCSMRSAVGESRPTLEVDEP